MKIIIRMMILVLLSVAALDMVNGIEISEGSKRDVKERKFGIGVKNVFLWKFGEEQDLWEPFGKSICYPAFVYISFKPTLSILGFPVSEVGIGSNLLSEQKYCPLMYIAAKSSMPSPRRALNPYIGFSLGYFNFYPHQPLYLSISPTLLDILVGTELSIGSHLCVTSEIRCTPQTLVGISKTVAICVGLIGYISW